jgi:hypothetical protein
MYFFDPNVGNRRRALVRDQFVHAGSKACKAADVVKRDAANRWHGVVAELRSSLRPDHPSDDVLEARVRSALGRCVSHPAAIEVHSQEGCVCLSGPVLADEVQQVVDCVRNVRGVHHIENELDVYDEPGNVSALQGGRRRTGATMELAQQSWSPTAQALIGAAGLGVATCCATRGNPLGVLVGAAGMALAFNAFTHIDARGRQTQVGRPGTQEGQTSAADQTAFREPQGVGRTNVSAASERAVMHDL